MLNYILTESFGMGGKMFLKDAKMGKDYTVTGIWLGKRVTHRLEALGMTRGTVISVINKKSSGSMVIKIRGTRFALGAKFTQGIAVRGDLVG